MQRVASILAHVLASTALVACGGSIAEVPEQRTTTPTSPTNDGGPGATLQGPPVVDGGKVDASRDSGTVDAGCAAPPKLLRTVSCSDVWQLPCGIPSSVNVADGLSREECQLLCGTATPPHDYWTCEMYPQDDLPGPAVACHTCIEGRRPSGYVEPQLDPTIAGWLAHAADLERVSIDAFAILGRELAFHGAPEELVRRAARAEEDEVRHARVLAHLARREGATLVTTEVNHGPVRALVDIALENAVEGCIRETYGALVAGWQAEHAMRIDIRRAMKPIYRDETSHAELAWHVHDWIMEKLTTAERRRVETAMREAANELAVAASHAAAPSLIDALGLPPPEQAKQLVAGLEIHLWTGDEKAA